MKTRPIDAEFRARLCELLEVDPTIPNGFHWKVKRGPKRAGSPAGCFSKSNGYWQVQVDGKLYQAHRLVWALTHDEDPGDRQIDHMDGDRGNNDPDNLRLATRGENLHNSKLPCTNTSGYKGVRRRSDHASWLGRVKVHRRSTSKTFSDSKYGGTEAALAAAVEWTQAMREKLHGDFARHE